jgi:hypothetical protein
VVNNRQAPGCDTTGKVCCNGICVTAQAGECPICCQNGPDCATGNCVGNGACLVAGIDVCSVGGKQGKCCRP